jgi:hypothetical protein
MWHKDFVSCSHNPAYWMGYFPPSQPWSSCSWWKKAMIVFLLLAHLELPLSQFLIWLFSCRNPKIRHCVGHCLAYHPNYDVPFVPKVLTKLWHTFSQAVPYLHQELILPCAHKITLMESDMLMTDQSQEALRLSAPFISKASGEW